MLKDFLSWVAGINEAADLQEVSRRDQMGYADPFQGQADAKQPRKGDIVISSPSAFFGGKKGGSLRDIMASVYILNSDQSPADNSYQAMAMLPRRGPRDRQFTADDIMYDVTWRYPEHERRLGNSERQAVNVWLYIPPEAEEYKQKYVRRAAKAAETSPDTARQAAEFEDRERTDKLSAVQALGGDVQKVADKGAKDDRAKYFREQESRVHAALKGGQDADSILRQLFADEDPNELRNPQFHDYLRRVGATTLADYLTGKDIKAAYQGPNGNELDQRIAAASQTAPAQSVDASDDAWQRLVQSKAAPTPAAPQDDLDARLKAVAGQQAAPATDDAFDKLVQQYRMAAQNSRDPKAAMQQPLPTAKAESVRHRGVRLLGENTRSYPKY